MYNKLLKKVLRTFLLETLALYIASGIAYGIVYEHGAETLIFAGIALTFSSIIVKPIINLLLLPINLITFNLFKWVGSAIALYLVTIVVPGFRVVSFNYSGLTSTFIDLPSIDLTGAAAIIAFSFIIAIFTGVINWIIS